MPAFPAAQQYLLRGRYFRRRLRARRCASFRRRSRLPRSSSLAYAIRARPKLRRICERQARYRCHDAGLSQHLFSQGRHVSSRERGDARSRACLAGRSPPRRARRLSATRQLRRRCASSMSQAAAVIFAHDCHDSPTIAMIRRAARGSYSGRVILPMTIFSAHQATRRGL